MSVKCKHKFALLRSMHWQERTLDKRWFDQNREVVNEGVLYRRTDTFFCEKCLVYRDKEFRQENVAETYGGKIPDWYRS